MPKCPWDREPVRSEGITCSEDCYRLWLGKYGNSIVPDNIDIPEPHWLQPWYHGSKWRGNENN